MAQHADVVVVGAGPAGLTAAIATASAGLETVLIAGHRTPDHRTTALLGGSVTALTKLGVWHRCQSEAAPLRKIRLIDDTGRLLHAPETCFDAAEIGEEAFGWNIENQHLMEALSMRAAELAKLERVDAEATSIQPRTDGAEIEVGARCLTARLVIGADGRRSLCRAAAGIETRQSDYPQVALTFNLHHSRPHGGVSTEFHTAHGPFTLVPLPGSRSSLVWVTDPDEAAAIRRLTENDLNREIERRSCSILGKVTIEPGSGAFPLSLESAERMAAARIALVGEAGHLMPPIGAQGLNLGLRDAATIAELAGTAADPGDDEVLETYNKRRLLDAARRQVAVDLLNKSLLTAFLPVQALRSIGMMALGRIGPLRRALMREGIAPLGVEPALMQQD
jgi:2-octaprenyl-6-methoxyphenol hydroxylase